MNFKDKFVNHGKIYITDFTLIKINCSQGSMIDFSTVKIAIHKLTIDKTGGKKNTIGKITIYKSAIFIFFITDFILAINDSFKFSI